MEEDYATSGSNIKEELIQKSTMLIKRRLENFSKLIDFTPYLRQYWVSPDGGCIDYRKLNEATRKDHFPLPFMDQMLERLAGNEYYCFLDGFSGYFQIPIDPRDQEKTTFTCPYGTFAYRRMPFGLCNASGTFQRCMLAIFHDMVEKTMEVFMDDFSVFGNSFQNCLSRLDHMLQRNAENLAAVYLSRLEIPYENVNDLKRCVARHGSSRTFSKLATIGTHGRTFHVPTSRKNFSRDEMLKTPSKFEKSLTFGAASTLRAVPVFTIGEQVYSRGLFDYLSKWVKRKRSHHDSRSSLQILKSLFARIWLPPRAIISTCPDCEKDSQFYVIHQEFSHIQLNWNPISYS
ncbi:reverse transcriptase domain-containing protein [Tanacetum coccineum]